MHGWAVVEIGGHRLDVSCIEPVPEMLLTAFIRGLSCGGAAETRFNAEGWYWRMEAAEQTRLTIETKTTKETHTVPVDVRQLAAGLLADLKRDMDAWCAWQPSVDAAAQRAALECMCRQLEKLL